MSHKYAKHLFSTILIFISCTAFAQNSNKENDPYARYGIGNLVTGTNIAARGMGYQNSAYAPAFFVNSENPASYASLLLTTYEAGLYANRRTLYSNGTNYPTGSASLAYLNIGIPVGKYAGFNIGLKPESKVYYKLQNDTGVSGLGNNTLIYSGDGGLNYAFIGGAAKVEGFSVGFNFGYMFGTVRNSSVVQQIDTYKVLSSEFTRYTKIGGLYWSTGVMYQAKLKENLQLLLGGTFTLNQSLSGERDQYWVNFRSLNGVIDEDTSYHETAQKGKIELPVSYSFGAQLLSNEKWKVGADFTMAQWSQYRNYGVTDSVADKTMKLSAGGEYTPNILGRGNYLQRMTYRIGVYYGTDYVRLRNTSLNYYALTVGAGLPFKRGADRINTALEIGKRGTETNGLIRENFVRFSIGISLNDRWFQKRRYD